MAIDLGTIKATITADTGKFDTAIGGVLGNMGKMVGVAAKAAAAVAAVGTAATVASVKMAGDFESAMTSAGAKAGATAAQLRAMEEAAFSASAASAFGASDAADAMGFLAQAGFEVEQQIGALPGVLNLASAGELELARAADITSNVLSGFALEVDQVGRVNDVLVKAANSANTSVTQLGDAMSYAAPSAAGAGIKIEETAAIIGKLSDAGIQGSRAGRGFNQILVQLSDVAGSLGTNMSAAEVQSIGFSAALAKLEANGLTAQNAVEHFGREAGPAIQALLGQGVGAIDELNTKLMEAGGTAEEVANTKIATLNGALNVLLGNIQNVAIKYGQSFVPALTETAEAASQLASLFFKSRGELMKMEESLGLTEGTANEVSEAMRSVKRSLTFSREETALLIEVTEKFIQSGLLMVSVLMETARAAKIAALSIRALNLATDTSASTAEEHAEHQRQLDQAYEDLGNAVDGIGTDFEALSKISRAVGEASDSLQRDVTSLKGTFTEAAKEAKAFALDGLDKISTAMDDLKEKASGVGQDVLDFMSGEMTIGVEEARENAALAEKEQAAREKARIKSEKQVAILRLQVAAEREKDEVRQRQLQFAAEIERIDQSDAEAITKQWQRTLARVKAEEDVRDLKRQQADEAEREAAAVRKSFSDKIAEAQKKAEEETRSIGDSRHQQVMNQEKIALQGMSDPKAIAKQQRTIELMQMARDLALERQRIEDAVANDTMSKQLAAEEKKALAGQRVIRQNEIEKKYQEQITAEKRKQRDEDDKKADKAERRRQEMIAGIANVATSLGSAVGLSDELQGALSGVANVATSLSQGNIFGAITGGISMVASLIGGGSDTDTVARDKTSPRDLARMIAEENVRAFEKSNMQPLVINADRGTRSAGRGGGRGNPRDRFNEMVREAGRSI